MTDGVCPAHKTRMNSANSAAHASEYQSCGIPCRWLEHKVGKEESSGEHSSLA